MPTTLVHFQRSRVLTHERQSYQRLQFRRFFCTASSCKTCHSRRQGLVSTRLKKWETNGIVRRKGFRLCSNTDTATRRDGPVPQIPAHLTFTDALSRLCECSSPSHLAVYPVLISAGSHTITWPEIDDRFWPIKLPHWSYYQPLCVECEINLDFTTMKL